MPPNQDGQYRYRPVFQPQAELGLATSGELGVDVWEFEFSRLRDRRRRCRLWSLMRGSSTMYLDQTPDVSCLHHASSSSPDGFIQRISKWETWRPHHLDSATNTPGLKGSTYISCFNVAPTVIASTPANTATRIKLVLFTFSLPLWVRFNQKGLCHPSN